MKKIVVSAVTLLSLFAVTRSADAVVTCPASSCTKLIDNGPDGGKRVAVILGDGYTSGEQAKFNGDVKAMIEDGLFGNDFFLETKNAFNVYRINLNSTDTALSSRTYDLKGTPTDYDDDTFTQTTRNTALKYIFSGTWEYCWLEHTMSGDTDVTEQLKNAALAANGLSHADYVFVMLDQMGTGGCNRGPRDIVQTRSVSWQVVGHEAGHGIGGLADEYSDSNRINYPDDAERVNSRNCSTTLGKNDVVWKRFIPAATAVPTTLSGGMDGNQSVGEFTGCSTYQQKIYRPVDNCRMNGNTPEFCPVCQVLLRKNLETALKHDLQEAIPGDFNGDGRTDLLFHNDGDISIYRGAGAGTANDPYRLDFAWAADNVVPSTPGSAYSWRLAKGDRFYVADFDGDNKDDVYVFNRGDWPDGPWFGLLRSDGTGLGTKIHYHGTLPLWGKLATGDRFFVADFDGDAKDDLYVFNAFHEAGAKKVAAIGMIRSTGAALQGKAVYQSSIPGSKTAALHVAAIDPPPKKKVLTERALVERKTTLAEPNLKRADLAKILASWVLNAGDRFSVGDFDGDAKEDLFVFNGTGWTPKRYMALVRSTGTGLEVASRYLNKVGDWKFASFDRQFVADIDGDHKQELYLAKTEGNLVSLALTKSDGAALSIVKLYEGQALAGWPLKVGDRFFPADFDGNGKTDLYSYNPTPNRGGLHQIGMLTSKGTTLEAKAFTEPIGGKLHLTGDQKLFAGNYKGGGGQPTFYLVGKQGWMGLPDNVSMIRRAAADNLSMDRLYGHWILNAHYDSKPWAMSLQ